jgi:hypothetical protein
MGAMRRAIVRPFKPGHVPTIACINRATSDLGVDFSSLVSALQQYVDMHLAPVWGTPAKLRKTTKPRENAWTMLFVDSADDIRSVREDLKKIFGKHAREVVAYHMFKGRPIALVFVKATLAGPSRLSDADRISLAASHELAEMLADPGNNLWCEREKGTLYAYEICDAVEAEHFPINGLAMSNFVYPAYFEAFHKHNSTQFDHLKTIKRPFEIPKDGYAPVRKAGKRKLMLHSSPAKARALRREDRDLHRSEFRRP